MTRLVDTDLERPQLTAAIDEALLEARIAGHGDDTVHLYRRSPPSVSIGYFQVADEVVDLDACRIGDIPVVRRVSGGGAIYTDERQLIYAIVLRPPRPHSTRDGFAIACGAIVRALDRLGVKGAEMAGLNDVLVGGSKVSGSAQTVRRGVHLIHGTIMVDADIEMMFKVLKPVPQKMEGQGIIRPSDRVTTLASVLGSPPPMEEVKRAVAEELAMMVGTPLVEGVLTAHETERARELEATKFTRDEWNMRR